MIDRFWHDLSKLKAPRVLECGTRTPEGLPGVSRRALVLRVRGATHVGVDALAGEGVDVVADLHGLPFPPGSFDAILCCSVLEHVERPWVVAAELGRVTREGGVLYCQSHQSFPLHHHPRDYFRFSEDALRVVFGESAGWHVVEAGHEFPCKVVPAGNHFTHAKDWNFAAEAYLNSWCLAERRP